MSENIKDKKQKRVPSTILTSINEVDFRKHLFKDEKKEKYSDKYKSNNSVSYGSNLRTKNQNNPNLNSSSQSENHIKDFNKNIFKSNQVEEVIKTVNELGSEKNINEDINHLIINQTKENENYSPNIENTIENNQEDIAQIKIQDQNLNQSQQEYDNLNNKYHKLHYRKLNGNKLNNTDDCKMTNINRYKDGEAERKYTYSTTYHNNPRKIYYNYNHLDTPGAYEDTKAAANKSLTDLNLDKTVDEKQFYLNNQTENNDCFEYDMINRTIKIPKRYTNFEETKKFEPRSEAEEEEFRVRIWHLLQNIYKFIDESRLDPILETFRENEILQEFFVQRILELIANIFDSEKEIYIQKLLLEKNKYEKNFIDTENIYNDLNSKLNILEENMRISKLKEDENTTYFTEREKELVSALSSKDEKIKNLLYELELQEKEFNELHGKFSNMNKDFENFKIIHDRLLNENSLLKSKIKFLEEESQLNNKRYGELLAINKKYEEENTRITKQLYQFREDYEIVKNENEKNKIEINRIIEENFTNKIKLDEKTRCLEELRGKYNECNEAKEKENIKYQSEIDRLNKKIAIIEDSIKNTYKIKNSALKTKLREKVELLDKTNIEYETYKKEKERLIAKMLQNHQSILNDKNIIIEELIKKNTNIDRVKEKALIME